MIDPLTQMRMRRVARNLGMPADATAVRGPLTPPTPSVPAQFSRLVDALNARVKSGLPEGALEGVVPAYVGGPKDATKSFSDLLPDDLFILKNRYVVSGTAGDAEAAARALAKSPARERFLSALRNRHGEDMIVYRVGPITPGKLQSYSTDPARLGFFKNKGGGEPLAYRVKSSDVAFPGSDADAELVINSANVTRHQ